MNDVLDTGIRYLKGVGEQREKLFNKLGIVSLRDLAGFFPRAYSDRTDVKPINELVIGSSVCVRALVSAKPQLSRIRKGLDLVKFRAVDETGSLMITYFNAPYIRDALVQGETYIFYGKVSGSLLQPEMTNPVFERDDEDIDPGNGQQRGIHRETLKIVPIYPLTAKLTQKMLRTAVSNALIKCGDVLPDVLPGDIAGRFELCRARYAYFNIHFPASFRDLDIARKRLIFEELFVLVTAMRLMRGRRGEQAGMPLDLPDMREFYDALPFMPTGAQKRAIDEALGDMKSGMMMNRLIQGDVGSGKTLVAAACAWAAWRGGAQSALMAPTEILAKQHYDTLTRLLEPMGMRVGLLTGSMTAKNKKETYARLQGGGIDLIAGTHALLSAGVVFKNLALVITDEQHRFGVAQRSALSAMGGKTSKQGSSETERFAHVLVMSATPIPRTLALVIYGDLSVSVIDEMPPGRNVIETHVIGESHRQRAYSFARKLIGEGRQVYIICPRVEESEEEDTEAMLVKSAKEYYEKLRTEVFADLSVALVHGKMPAKEKDKAMSGFASGDVDILVATTVVEVGVDVPNAALMLIENADRYGLSQLHQLRGRVGRGEHKSYCVLFQTPQVTGQSAGQPAQRPSERLQIMKATNDGFKIAEEDLKMRGPGDFFGERQHGLPQLRIANLASDMMVLNEAQAAATEVLSADPLLKLPAHRALAEQIERMFGSAAVS